LTLIEVQCHLVLFYPVLKFYISLTYIYTYFAFYPFVCVVSAVKFIAVLKEYVHTFVICSSSMQEFKYPDRLSNLAVEAFGRYVSRLLLRLVRYLVRTDVTEQNYVHKVCGDLQEVILKAVPPLLANDVTIKLMRHLDRRYWFLKCVTNYSCLEDVASKILCAIIHPDVMRLECSDVISHLMPIDYYKPAASSFIYLALPMLKDLKVLKLGRASKTLDCEYRLTYISEHLEQFSSCDCSDKDVELLSKSCKRLMSLDLTLSVHVSDASLPFLTKFQYLEKLNVNGTSISQNGLTELLTALAKTEVKGYGDPVCRSLLLKSFGCDNPLNAHIDLLVANFQNLTSLCLCHVQENISVIGLRHLAHLRNFALINTILDIILEVLEVIGLQLKCLYITLPVVSDLKYICDYCPSLHCLHVFFYWRRCFRPEATPALPVFHSVQCLDLDYFEPCRTGYILSRFVNVRRLNMRNCGSRSLYESLLCRKELKHLQQLFWGSQTFVEFSGEQPVITGFSKSRIAVYSAKFRNLDSLIWTNNL
jgi:hypothetical protein